MNRIILQVINKLNIHTKNKDNRNVFILGSANMLVNYKP